LKECKKFRNIKDSGAGGLTTEAPTMFQVRASSGGCLPAVGGGELLLSVTAAETLRAAVHRAGSGGGVLAVHRLREGEVREVAVLGVLLGSHEILLKVLGRLFLPAELNYTHTRERMQLLRGRIFKQVCPDQSRSGQTVEEA